MERSNPLWNSTSSIEWHLDLRGQGQRSRSRSLQRKYFRSFFDPLGMIRSWPNFVAILGMTPAMKMPKVATLGQRGRNGGGIKVLGYSIGGHLYPTQIIFFHVIKYTHVQGNSTEHSVARFAHSMQLWEMWSLRPPFPGFSCFCQSLARNGVTAVADTRACYTSLERAQKTQQNGTNTIFDFASLRLPGKTITP